MKQSAMSKSPNIISSFVHEYVSIKVINVYEIKEILKTIRHLTSLLSNVRKEKKIFVSFFE